MKKVFTDNSERIYCGNCQNPVATIERGVVAYEISCICNCGAFERAASNAKEIDKADGAPIYGRDDTFVCMKCRSDLIRIREDLVRSIAFKIKCGCGEVYNERRKAPKSRRHLGIYAIFDKSDY